MYSVLFPVERVLNRGFSPTSRLWRLWLCGLPLGLVLLIRHCYKSAFLFYSHVSSCDAMRTNHSAVVCVTVTCSNVFGQAHAMLWYSVRGSTQKYKLALMLWSWRTLIHTLLMMNVGATWCTVPFWWSHDFSIVNSMHYIKNQTRLRPNL